MTSTEERNSTASTAATSRKAMLELRAVMRPAPRRVDSRDRACFDHRLCAGTCALELAAQVGDVCLDHVGVVFPVVVVEVFEHLTFTDDLARVVDEVLQYPVLSRGKIDEGSGPSHGLFQRVQFHVERTQRGMSRALAPPNEGLAAGNEFAEVERLGEIVVGARVQEVDD